MQLLPVGICIIGGCFAWIEVGVCGRGKNSVQPCLLVFVSGGREGSSRKLFGIEAMRGFLRRIGADWKSALNSFGSTRYEKGQ
jgi:hypothetical protein